ncbi:hypothetical protein N7507_006702 [Penicillium longicatenatum]|nr:hypothetical protein N7507_006702 [Penicillium longicatenatum]
MEGLCVYSCLGGLEKSSALVDEALVPLLESVHGEDGNELNYVECLVLSGALQRPRRSLGKPWSVIWNALASRQKMIPLWALQAVLGERLSDDSPPLGLPCKLRGLHELQGLHERLGPENEIEGAPVD